MPLLDGAGDLMAVYGVSFYGVGQFGIDPATVRPDFSVAPFTSTPLDYASLHLQWSNPPSSDCAYLRLVRNPRNLPQDENDGVQVFDVNEFSDHPPEAPSNVFGDPNDSIVTGEVTYLTDLYLPFGFQYYSMFGWSTSEGIWIRCTDLIGLVPVNWSYGARLYNLLPMAYRDRDFILVDPYNPWPVDSPTPPLQRYLQLIGFQFDFLRTELESLMSINNAQTCSGALLPLMMQQFGLVHEPEMGMQQERQLVQNAIHLYKIKGSPRGITEFTSILTSYPSTQLVHHGYNELLTRDDSVGADDAGTWQPWPPVGTNFPSLPTSNGGLTIDFVNNLLTGPDAIAGMTDPVGEIYGGNFPTLQPPYTNSGLNVQAAGANALLAENSSFEGGTVGNWVAGANTNIANSVAAASAGTHSLMLTSTRNNNNSVASLTSAAGSVSAYPNTPFLATADLRGLTGQNRQVGISIQWFNAAGTSLGTVTGVQNTEVTGDWVTATVTGTSPAGVDHVTLTVTVFNTTNNEQDLVDNVWLGRGGQDIVITTAPIPITDFMSQYYAKGTITFRIQIWSSVARQVALSVWGDVGSGNPVQIIAPQTFNETAGHWVQMTVTGPINPYPTPAPAGTAPPFIQPYGAAAFYWIYPRIRIIGAGAEPHYITLMGLWPCTPAQIGVDTPVYDYPRDIKILVQPTASNLLSNTLTTFSRSNPSPPPATLAIGFDGLTNAADPKQATTNLTCTLVYRPSSVEDPPGLMPINGNAALEVDTTGPGATVWFGMVTSWSTPPPSPLGWFSPGGNWFSGATQGTLPRAWFDPVNSWFFINQNYFGVGSAWVNGLWFPRPAQPTMYGNLSPFQVNAGQPFNFSVYAQYMTVQDPSNALMQLGFRWYYPDGTWVEVTNQQMIGQEYDRYSIAPATGPFYLSDPPPEASTGAMPTTMYPFVRFPNAQAARFLLNSAMLTAGETLSPYMDASSLPSSSGDFVTGPTNASYLYPRRTPRIARLTAEMYRWVPMGSTYTITYASGAVTPPLDPTLWP